LDCYTSAGSEWGGRYLRHEELYVGEYRTAGFADPTIDDGDGVSEGGVTGDVPEQREGKRELQTAEIAGGGLHREYYYKSIQ
jgi:hypothetical protein